MKAVVGLLARHTVFLRSLFSSAFTRCVSSYCDNPSFTVCLQASLSVAGTSQESVVMPSVWRSRLHTSLKRSCGRHVGLSPVASSPYKGPLECGHLSSVSHVLAIACTFALRERISLVSQPFLAQLYAECCINILECPYGVALMAELFMEPINSFCPLLRILSLGSLGLFHSLVMALMLFMNARFVDLWE